MKIAIVVATAGLASLSLVGAAGAAGYKLSPPSTKFTGTGPTSATTTSGVSLSCTAKFAGSTNKAGVGKISSGSFTGELGCSAVTLGNLPWKAEALTATTGEILNVEFDSPIGNCGPGTVPATISGAGVISFNTSALKGCSSVSGTIQTTPKVTIVPK
jgi:hypothetical protein